MKCFVIYFTLVLLWRSVENYTTPLGLTCRCILLKNCAEVSNMLKTTSTYNRQDLISFIQRSHCGFEGEDQKICCGPPTFQLKASTTTKPTTVIEIEPVNSTDSYLPAHQQCGYDGGNRIYGGNVTDIDEFPWMALLGYKSPQRKSISYSCGGSLINARYVLTAAHCVVGQVEIKYGKLTTVRLGEYDVLNATDCIKEFCADPVQEISVQSMYVHPDFKDVNSVLYNDIAVVRLAKRAKFTISIAPICLMDDSEQVNTGDPVSVAGWGQTLEGTKSVIKQKLEMTIAVKTDCVRKYKTKATDVTSKQICAGGVEGEDTCRGDSGGPLMRLTSLGVWEEIGIISFGYGCGMKGWPGIYTYVPSYMNWVKTTIRNSNV